MPRLGRLEMGATARHSRDVGRQRSQGAFVLALLAQVRAAMHACVTRRVSRTRGARAAVRSAAFICCMLPGVATAQVSAWDADPGCPAPSNLPLSSFARRPDAPADDLSVRVTVTAVQGGWRAVLAASDHGGAPMGERVLEHPTCEELNRAVLVSLSVLLGTQSPAASDASASAPGGAAATRSSADAEAEATPATTTEAPATTNEAPLATEATQQPASPELAPALQPAEVTERRSPEDRRRARASEQVDEAPAQSVSRRWSLPRPDFDLYGGVAFGLESTAARTYGVAASVLVSDRNWGVRSTGVLRKSVGDVAENPDVSFWAATLGLGACKYLSNATWLICGGPNLERLQGSVPAATNKEAEAWLWGAGVSVSTLHHLADTWGWFAEFEFKLRRGASFELESPPQTMFQYPSIGLLLSVGPAVRL